MAGASRDYHLIPPLFHTFQFSSQKRPASTPLPGEESKTPSPQLSHRRALANPQPATSLGWPVPPGKHQHSKAVPFDSGTRHSELQLETRKKRGKLWDDTLPAPTKPTTQPRSRNTHAVIAHAPETLAVTTLQTASFAEKGPRIIWRLHYLAAGTQSTSDRPGARSSLA